MWQKRDKENVVDRPCLLLPSVSVVALCCPTEVCLMYSCSRPNGLLLLKYGESIVVFCRSSVVIDRFPVLLPVGRAVVCWVLTTVNLSVCRCPSMLNPQGVSLLCPAESRTCRLGRLAPVRSSDSLLQVISRVAVPGTVVPVYSADISSGSTSSKSLLGGWYRTRALLLLNPSSATSKGVVASGCGFPFEALSPRTIKIANNWPMMKLNCSFRCDFNSLCICTQWVVSCKGCFTSTSMRLL